MHLEGAVFSIRYFNLVRLSNFFREFDSSSGRTLAAWIRHASRMPHLLTFIFGSMYYVYAIKSRTNNKIYFGYTTNLRKRLADHNKGRSKYTKRYVPWTLIYYEAYLVKSDAKNREKQLKHHGKVWSHLKRRINDLSNKS